MGSETFYCAKCATRLPGSDVKRVGNQVFCSDCAPPDVVVPTPPARLGARPAGSSPRHARSAEHPASRPAPAPVWPWAAGGIAAGVVVLAVVISTASRPAPPPPVPVPVPAPRPPAPGPAPRADAPPPAPAPDVERLEEAVTVLLRQQAFADAFKRAEEASGWRADEAGMRRILALRTRVLNAARERLAVELAEASAARARRDEGAVARTRERVVAWGVRELVVEFDRGLPKAPEAPWRALFDGATSASVLGGGSDASWPVKDGAIERIPDRNDAAQSKLRFADAEFRIRFEARGLDVARFSVRQGAEGICNVPIQGREAEGAHELVLVCRGADVAATLDGRPLNVETHGMPKEGHLQFNHTGGRLRVKSIEVR